MLSLLVINGHDGAEDDEDVDCLGSTPNAVSYHWWKTWQSMWSAWGTPYCKNAFSSWNTAKVRPSISPINLSYIWGNSRIFVCFIVSVRWEREGANRTASGGGFDAPGSEHGHLRGKAPQSPSPPTSSLLNFSFVRPQLDGVGHRWGSHRRSSTVTDRHYSVAVSLIRVWRWANGYQTAWTHLSENVDVIFRCFRRWVWWVFPFSMEK